jgi:DNA-binding NarL/FixJ family response regulator
MNSSPKLAGKLIRVFVADSSRIHTQLLAAALRSDEAFEVTECAATFHGIVAETTEHNPDVVIVSSTLSGELVRGFDLVREMRAAHPTLRVVMLLDSANRDIVLEAFRSGAKGIFNRSESLETLRKCISCVHRGQVWASAEQMAYAVEALAAAPVVRATDSKGLSLLSKRELQVVQCLAEGLTNREIAQRMGLSQHTVKNYLFKVFEKLGVTSRVELLFMTMSQAGSPLPSRTNSPSPVDTHGVTGAAMYQKAAEEGFPSAQLMVAQMYYEGRGVPKDPVSAYMWYLICEQSADELKDEVSEQKQALLKALTPEQLLQARERAKQYVKKLAKLTVHALQNGMAQSLACLVCFIVIGLIKLV